MVARKKAKSKVVTRKKKPAKRPLAAAIRRKRPSPRPSGGAVQTRVAVPTPAADVPSFFRLNIEVGNLDEAEKFYGELFGVEGRRQRGSRIYFNAGPVALQVVDVSIGGIPHPAAKALYFTVQDLDAIHARAKSLDALSTELVHGEPGGEIAVRPWGERSFYAEDPWGNPLCFVQQDTTYSG